MDIKYYDDKLFKSKNSYTFYEGVVLKNKINND